MVRQRFLGGTYGKDLGGGRDGFYNTLVVDDKARRSHWTIVWVVRMRHPEHLQDLDLKKNEERKKGKKEKRKKGKKEEEKNAVGAGNNSPHASPSSYSPYRYSTPGI